MWAMKALILPALIISLVNSEEATGKNQVRTNGRTVLSQEKSADTSRRLALGGQYSSDQNQNEASLMSDREATDLESSGSTKLASQSRSGEQQGVVAQLHARLEDASKMSDRLYQELKHQGSKLRRKIKTLRDELRKQQATAAQSEQKLKRELDAANNTLQQSREQLEEQQEKERQLVGTERGLRAQLNKAEVLSEREQKSKRQQLAMELAQVQKQEHDVRLKLAKERKNVNRLRSLLNRTSTAGGHLRKQVQLQQHALSDLQLTQKNTLLSFQKEQFGYRTELSTAMRAEDRLRERLKELARTSAGAADRLRSNLTRTEANTKRLHAALLEKERQTASLSANLTRIVAAARASATAAHKDHVSLLLQVSDMQEKMQQLQKRIEHGAKAMKANEKMFETAGEAEEAKAKQLARRQQQQVGTLQQVSSTMKARLSKALTDLSAQRAEAGALEQSVASSKQQLRAAAAAFEDAAAARDAANKRLAASSSTSEKERVLLAAAAKDLKVLQGELMTAKNQVSSSIFAKEKQAKRSADVMKELAKAQLAAKSSQAEAQTKLRQMEVEATLKVRTSQDEAENLRRELKQTQVNLAQADDEGAKAKDNALREADEALQASHRVEALNSRLAEVQREADDTKDHAEALQTSGDSLRQQRDQAEQQLEKRAQDATELHAKMEELQTSVSLTAKELDGKKKENDKMRSKAEQLMYAESRVESLGQEYEGTQNALKKINQQNAAMKKQLQMLRDLKDRYAEENDQARNETSTWHSKATDLQAKLDREDKTLLQAKQDREDALDKAREAGSRENSYFDDNSRLHSQNEALKSQLAEAFASSNKTSEQENRYKGEVTRLREEKQQDQENSHAAWVEAENELLASKTENQAAAAKTSQLQAEIARTRAMLTADQRKALGMPPAAPVKASAPPEVPQPAVLPVATPVDLPVPSQPALAPPPPAALPAATPFQPAALNAAFAAAMPMGQPAGVPLAVPNSQLTAFQPAAPLTPQVAHLKQWKASVQPPGQAQAVAPLAGEPQRPTDNAAELLAAVDVPAAQSSSPAVSSRGLVAQATPPLPPVVPAVAPVVPAVVAAVPPRPPPVTSVAVLATPPQKPMIQAAAAVVSALPDTGAEDDSGKTPLQKLAEYFNR